MRGQLITDRARTPVLIVVAAAVAVVGVLAAVVWHGTTTSFDTWAFTRAYLDFGAQDSTGRRFWLLFSEPALAFAVPAAVAVWAAVTRRWNLLALAVVGPVLALGITEVLGKPLVARVLGPGVLQGSTAGAVTGSYPSGHETGLVSWLVLAVVVVFTVTTSVRRRTVAIVAAVLWALAGALGLTINYYHYATDTFGAIGVAVAVLLGLALVIDPVADLVGGSGRRTAGVS